MTITQWNEQGEWQGWSEITTTCECGEWNDDETVFTPSQDCYGDCWQYNLEWFKEATLALFDNNDKSLWEVNGLPLWNKDVNGTLEAKSPEELLRGITVNGDYTFRWKVIALTLRCWLSHHDKPTGAHYSVTIAE